MSPEELAAEYHAAARAAHARAVFHAAQGDVPGALAEEAQAVRLAPSDPELRLAYAQRLAEIGRVRDAEAFLRGASERFGPTPGEQLLTARLDFLAGRLDAAERGAKAALAADSSRAEAWELRGRIALQHDQPETALDALEHAAALGADAADLDELRAACEAKLGRSEAAAQRLERVLDADPGRLEARRALATILRQLGRTTDARTLLRQALEVAPDDPDAVELALESFVEAGDLDGAANMLAPYYRSGSLGPRLQYLYGRVLLQQDHWSAADSVLRPLATLEGVRGIESLLGDIAVRAGHTAEARAHYRRAIDQQPGDCTPAASLALLVVQEQRRIRDAGGTPSDSLQTEFDAALKTAERGAGERDYRCHLLLGLAYTSARRFADALPHLEATLELDPDDADAMFNLAMAHQELGHYDQALALARQLLERHPDNAAAMNFVGYALAERGSDLQTGERLIRAALVKEPNNGYFVDSLGWVLYQKGEFRAAAAALERAVRLLKEHDALVLEHLGDAYVRIGRFEAAKRAYQKSHDLDTSRAALTEKLADVESHLQKH